MLKNPLDKNKNGYNKPVQRTDHPHIVKVEGVFGGRAIIEGTSLGVSTLVQCYKAEETFDDILFSYPQRLLLANFSTP
ncbi:MAG: hypothetical protein B6244_06170 [Candidatus Cloacimonetes bacterium 4572_55]|nr:MAG: hypothetical protein B6244_06170 [Candidatus Cloacimonetes bacterium 4572_55]